MSEQIGATYYLFVSSDGEWFSGGGAFTHKQFAKFIAEELEQSLLELLKENPNRTISLVMDIEEGWGEAVPFSDLEKPKNE